MKVALLTILGSSVFFFSTLIFAGCCGGAGSGAYCQGRCPVYETEYETTCQCSDVNCGTNSCLSRAKCCEAFGNVGAR